MPPRFALLGAAAAVADRHARAIFDLGGQLAGTADPAGAPASIGERFPDSRHFDSVEELVSQLDGSIDYLVVCTPNDLHEAHVELGLRMGADVICEKPVALEPAGVDRLLASPWPMARPEQRPYCLCVHTQKKMNLQINQTIWPSGRNPDFQLGTFRYHFL